MRVIAVATVALLALTACKKADEAAKPAEPAAAADGGAQAQLPKRKEGLWEQIVTPDASAPISTRICLDEATDAKLSIQGQQLAGAQCSKQAVSKQADGYSFSSTCSMGSAGTIVSSGAASGDFNSAYKVEATSTTSGAGAPQMNRTSKMVIAARYLGPCPSGWMPGDVELPGGTRINTVATLDAMQNQGK